jgi:hypothetical protein
MKSHKTPPENKTHYGGIYIFLMNQKLANSKKNKETPNN